jgi:hypothetical protein
MYKNVKFYLLSFNFNKKKYKKKIVKPTSSKKKKKKKKNAFYAFDLNTFIKCIDLGLYIRLRNYRSLIRSML